MLRDDYFSFYNQNNFTLVPIKRRGKAPEISSWQNRRPRDFNPAEFDDEANVGVVLGDASGGLVDIDLDCKEALILAPLFLPATGFRFGRKSKPESHHFYRCQKITEGQFVCRAVTAGPCLNAAGMAARR